MQQPLSMLLAEHKKGAKLESVAPDNTVADAVRQMNTRKIGSVLVMEGDRLAGIFTERDVLVRVVAAQIDPAATPVREVMTSHLITVKPSTTVQEALVTVTEKRCRHLPVIDNDKVVGLVSIGDLTRWVVRDQKQQIDDLIGYITTG